MHISGRFDSQPGFNRSAGSFVGNPGRHPHDALHASVIATSFSNADSPRVLLAWEGIRRF